MIISATPRTKNYGGIRYCTVPKPSNVYLLGHGIYFCSERKYCNLLVLQHHKATCGDGWYLGEAFLPDRKRTVHQYTVQYQVAQQQCSNDAHHILKSNDKKNEVSVKTSVSCPDPYLFGFLKSESASTYLIRIRNRK
jgi:hypothetical protein